MLERSQSRYGPFADPAVGNVKRLRGLGLHAKVPTIRPFSPWLLNCPASAGLSLLGSRNAAPFALLERTGGSPLAPPPPPRGVASEVVVGPRRAVTRRGFSFAWPLLLSSARGNSRAAPHRDGVTGEGGRPLGINFGIAIERSIRPVLWHSLPVAVQALAAGHRPANRRIPGMPRRRFTRPRSDARAIAQQLLLGMGVLR